MKKIKAFILIMLGIIFCLTEPVLSKVTEDGKDKKGSKSKKGIKTKSNKQLDDDFEEQLSCSCSCQTLQIPKKAKKAQLKVQNRQEPSTKKQAQKQIKRRKVPLRQGQSRFKSLKKSYDDVKQQQQEPAIQIKTQVPQQKSQRKIKKTAKSREQGKSKKKSHTQTSKPQVENKEQL